MGIHFNIFFNLTFIINDEIGLLLVKFRVVLKASGYFDNLIGYLHLVEFNVPFNMPAFYPKIYSTKKNYAHLVPRFETIYTHSKQSVMAPVPILQSIIKNPCETAEILHLLDIFMHELSKKCNANVLLRESGGY